MGLPTDKLEARTPPRHVGFDVLAREAAAYDRAVDASGLLDPFCSGSAWVLSAREAFGEELESFVVRTHSGWAPLMRMETVLGRTIVPLEASWGLAAPIVGPDRREAAREFAAFALERRASWDALFLSGLVRGAPDFTAIVHQLGRNNRLGLGKPTVRSVARLDGGLDGFLSRRTAKFRKNLRRVQRKAEGALRFETSAPTGTDEALAAYEQILQIEVRSWKGRSGHGIDAGPMNTFYRAMVPRLAARGELRITFAREASTGEAVGYVLGGIRGDGYRGLQISFDADYTELSLGNLLQLHTIDRLCAEGIVAYDLGTDMEYKRLWAEQQLTTVPLVVR
jgi:CelD/BcsL family acetyltransferase involved in cellulose biosynthesis